MADIVRREYTTRDFTTLRDKLTTYLRVRFPTASNALFEDDVLQVLLELVTYCGDQLAFYTDMAVNECLWDTVGQRANIIALAKLLGYDPLGISSAEVTLSCTTEAYTGSLSIAKGTLVRTSQSNIDFEVAENYVFNGDTAFEIAAVQGKTRTDVFYSDGQTGQLFKSMFDSVSSSVVPVVTVDGTVWTRVKFLWDQVTGNYYELTYTEDSRIQVIFGDGVHGNIPPSSSEINIVYMTADGAPGNLPIGSISSTIGAMADGAPWDVLVTNEEPSSGGSPAETVDEIRVNAPIAFQSLGNITTEKDLKGFCERYAGILRAGVAIESGTKVVRIALVGDGYVAPSGSLINSLKDAIEEKLVIGPILSLDPARFPLVDIQGQIFLYPNYSVDQVRDSINGALAQFFTPDNVQLSGKTVGLPVHLSDIMHLLDAVDGVDYLRLTKLARQPVPETVVWQGDGTFAGIVIGTSSKDELWTLEFTSQTQFVLRGSSSGLQTNIGTVDAQYTTDGSELTFTLVSGDITNEQGDYATIRVSKFLDDVTVQPDEFTLQGSVSLLFSYSE